MVEHETVRTPYQFSMLIKTGNRKKFMSHMGVYTYIGM